MLVEAHSENGLRIPSQRRERSKPSGTRKAAFAAQWESYGPTPAMITLELAMLKK